MSHAFNYSMVMYRIQQEDKTLDNEYLELADQCFRIANGRVSKDRKMEATRALSALSRTYPILAEIYYVSLLRGTVVRHKTAPSTPSAPAPTTEIVVTKKWNNDQWKRIYQHLLDVDEELGHPEHFEIPELETGIDYNILPETSGIYLLGDTRFNPNNKQQFYSVKGGLASNLRRRIKEQYLTHNPMPYLIGYLEVPSEYYKKVENQIHFALRRVATHRYGTNKEWYELPAEVYKEICDKKFDWFLK